MTVSPIDRTTPNPPPDWARLVTDSLAQNGPWHTYNKIVEARESFPNDMSLRGYAEIIRTVVVRDLLSLSKGMQAVPKMSPEFLSDFGRFNLTAQEGYLVSLIDGRLDLQKLLILSPFDAFTTLFSIAKLNSQKAITLPS
ncbi:MAG TPA: hypothetical protein VNM92_09490 [Thermoanaerobaculia bacterium]|nr:hypothetical protein [Thermoanaerobaculia bacterium]